MTFALTELTARRQHKSDSDSDNICIGCKFSFIAEIDYYVCMQEEEIQLPTIKTTKIVEKKKKDTWIFSSCYINVSTCPKYMKIMVGN